MFKYEDDPTLTCRLPPTSPPCCLTVSLSGPAKEAQGKCEGVYMSTGLFSLGREVTTIINKKDFLSLKVFKLKDSSDLFLFLLCGSWAIGPTLDYSESNKRYIQSS